MTVGQWKWSAIKRLCDAENPDAKVDVRILLEEILGLKSLNLSANRAVSETEISQLEAALSRRIAGEPLQYILGKAWWMGLCLRVDERVLIPRQDTETLAELALQFLRPIPSPRVLDLCTGSGAIGLCIAHDRSDARVTLADISSEALEVARENARLLGAQVETAQGDLFAPLAGREFDLIACNPPYIPTGEIGGLQAEVQKEPRLALDGGADGLDFYRRIAEEAPRYLAGGGYLLLEVGIGQAEAVVALVGGEAVRDLNGVERVVWTRRKCANAGEF
ncbi:MAG TPA: peptide chain release factor N(5)-glutamine methyltransferase [Candidatus Pullichristensenella excrementigallinarum]|uniref:Release factor glutamine methyltransferase n=1 Tax=Candidatus Pullichristensenella excrementigallinarum TaxID=2840907 RepID=A0A9D1LCR6_9FIRM|nr:peptide chain release factor N(5)-glutamine methyltransferase [Candidatus Pullichristensenella excrementigallinarum]